LSQRSQQIVRTVLGGILKEQVPSNGSQACNAEKTLKLLAERYYAGNGSNDNWPLVLRTMQSDVDHLGLTPHDDYKLALKALGQCIFFIHKCKLEPKVLPMARYQLYVPPDQLADVKPTVASTLRRSHMVLDATTLSNLRIIGEDHSLFSTLDHCCTKFGKRLLHHWLCAPSCDVAVIKERQDAIGELIRMPAELQEVRALLAPMPDFERNLAQIHLFGNKQIKQMDHPDSRAILFEEKIYNKQKLLGFMAVLKGFNTLTKLPMMFHQCETALLKRITQLPESGGSFPDLSKELKYFATAFDHEAAAKTGVIAPQAGMDAEYDSAMDSINEIEGRLKIYLVEQERHFGCRVTYFGSDKKRYQLDVPETHANKANKSYTLEGQTKGKKPSRRYTTVETRAFLKEMQHAEDTRNMVLKDCQWWVLKQDNFDCVLFFKVGKFYELYHMDADVGVNELGFTYMRGEFAHSGFPEISFDKMSTILIDRGFKVSCSKETVLPIYFTSNYSPGGPRGANGNPGYDDRALQAHQGYQV